MPVPGARRDLTTVAVSASLAVAWLAATTAQHYVQAEVTGDGATRLGAWVEVAVFRPGLWLEWGFAALVTAGLVSVQRPGGARVFVAAGPLLGLYTVSWIKTLVLGQPVGLEDPSTWAAAWATLPGTWCAAALIAVATWTGALVRNWRAPSGPAVAGAPLAMLLVAATVIAPHGAIAGLQRARPFDMLGREYLVRRSGLLVLLDYELAQRILVQRAVEAADPSAHPPPLAGLAPLAGRPDIYLISMESLVDPRNFRAERLDTFDPRFRRWMAETGGPALAPTFGSWSIRAEFEVLCGTPSEATGVNEYAAMHGAPADCLPRALAGQGYDTVVSNPVGPSFYNYEGAYRTLGFARRFFAPDFDMSDTDAGYLATASHLRQTDALVAAREAAPRLVLIALGSGHWPFTLGAARGEAPAPETDASRIASLAAHNTRAVADYIEALERRSPDAIVVVYGDHLPPLGAGGTAGYAELDYRLDGLAAQSPFWQAGADRLKLDRVAVPLIVRSGGHTVHTGPQPHYALADLVLDLASEGGRCAARPCDWRQPLAVRPLDDGLHVSSRDNFPAPACDDVAAGAGCEAARTRAAELSAARLSILATAWGPPPDR